MYCKKCGKELKEGAKFCPSCGEKRAVQNIKTGDGKPELPEVSPAAVSQPQTSSAPQPQAAHSQQEKPAGKKSGGKALIITLAVLFVAVLGIAAAILFYGSQSEGPDPVEPVAVDKSVSQKEAGLPESLEGKTTRSVTTAAAEPAIIGPSKLSPEEAEREVLAVREKWTSDREKILDNTYVSRIPEPGVTAYYNEQNMLVMIESTKDKDRDGFSTCSFIQPEHKAVLKV